MFSGPDPLPAACIGRLISIHRPALDAWMLRRAAANTVADATELDRRQEAARAVAIVAIRIRRTQKTEEANRTALPAALGESDVVRPTLEAP